MSAFKYCRIFFALLLTNFLILCGFLFSYYSNPQDKENFIFALILCLAAISATAFLVFSLLARICDKKKKNIALVDSFSKTYNLVEASRLSLGVYHDLSNILSSANLIQHEIIFNSRNNKGLESLAKRAFQVNQQANNLIKAFKFQCYDKGARANFYADKAIKKSLLLFNFHFVKKDIELFSSLKSRIKVFGDEVKFVQVVNNLISNAIESFREEDINKRVIITLKKEGARAVFRIKDFGVGISRDDLGKIFEPFFSSKNKKEKINCGIGLALSRKIIEEDFGGEISVESSLGQGSEFSLKIPLK
jgi:signal transduction histidine kinase